MAADSDGPGENLTTVVTCEGDLEDPEFPTKFNKILSSLHNLLCKDASSRNQLSVCKLEPWNSVRVTLTIPREAALKLRQLASEGSQQLRALGILSVQVEGDQVISLRLSGMLGQESREIILTTASSDAPNQAESSGESSSVVSGLTRILTASTTSVNQQSTSAEPSTSTVAEPKVQFKSPNVVCPTDTQVPKPPAQSSSPTTNLGHRNYNGPFPFTSMTHAAQAIHNRESTADRTTAVGNHFNQPPPPYPNKNAVATQSQQPNVAMSSPLLVNLLQNDGAQIQNKMLPPNLKQNLIKQKQETINNSSLVPGSEINSVNKDLIPSTNSAFAQTGANVQNKYPQNVPIPHVNPQLPQNKLQQPNPSLKIAPPNQVSTPPNDSQIRPSSNIRPSMYPRAPFRPTLQTNPTLNQPQLSKPPPYPRQRATFTENVMYQQTHFSSIDQNLGAIGQPMPNLSSLNQNLQPIAHPMPHLASLNQTLIENSLSNITPSLTDLSKTDLDDLLPSLEELNDDNSTPNDVPEALTSTGKPRQFLINPLTGDLEPMPSESSGSESEPDEKDNVFNDFPSPLHDRSNSIYSDEDTCSTTISRKTDQSDSEATVRSTNSENSSKSSLQKVKTKNRDRNRDSPNLKIKKEPEKIKLRLKLEKSEPVSPAYKVDVSFINTQQPKRALNLKPNPQTPVNTCNSLNEELRVPPLHISLRGRNSVVINTEKKKKYPKLNPDGSIIELKKKKISSNDNNLNLKLKKSFKNEFSTKTEVPGTSERNELHDKLISEADDSINAELKYQKFLDIKKSTKKSNKISNVDVYREQILLTGGNVIDDFKLHKKLIKDEKLKLGSSKKDKIGSKEKLLVGHVGEIRRGSDSDIVKGQKRHADSNGLLHLEKKRRLSQSEGKMSTSTITAESQGVNVKTVKLKSASPEPHLAGTEPQIVGSTNVGTVTTLSNKTVIKTSITQQTIVKTRRDKTTSVKTKESIKAKDLNRDKTYSQNVAEKLAKQLPLPIGEIDMEAKFKQSLLESSDNIPRRKFENKITEKNNQELVSLAEREKSNFTQENLNETDTRQLHEKKLEVIENKLETELRNHEKQSGRSPNSGGQGEDSGIESMDALSEKSPNQPNQSPHCHTDTLSLTESSELKQKSEKLDSFTDITDIEEQLAKLDGLPTLNGDMNHIIKTEPFIETETLIKKLEGKDKDLNENKECPPEKILDSCCNSELIKKEKTEKTKTEMIENLIKEEKAEIKVEEGKDLDFDPLPIRRKPPLYTYSNPEKQSRDSESPGPNLSDLDYNSDQSETENSKNKTRTRHRKVQESENDPKNPSTKNSQTQKSLLEQLLIEIPENNDKISAVSPAVSEKSATASTKSSIRTRSSSKLNSPDVDKKTPKHSPTSKDASPAISPTGTAKTSPKVLKIPSKRKRQESESSTQSNVSNDDANTRSKKSRKCSENAVELIKACMGVDTTEKQGSVVKNVVKETKKTVEKSNKSGGLLKKSQDLESSDSDEPLIEVAGKVRNKHITRNKINSTKSNISCSNINKNNTSVPSLTNVNNSSNKNLSVNLEEKIGTRRSVRNNNGANNNTTTNINTNTINNKVTTEVKTRSKVNIASTNSNNNSSTSSTNNQGEKTITNTIIGVTSNASDGDANTRRKTRSTVSDDAKRRRNSRDGK